MENLENQQQDFVDNPFPNRKPVKLEHDRGNVSRFLCQCNNSGCCVLDALQFVKFFIGKARENGVAAVKSRVDKSVHQFLGVVRV